MRLRPILMLGLLLLLVAASRPDPAASQSSPLETPAAALISPLASPNPSPAAATFLPAWAWIAAGFAAGMVILLVARRRASPHHG